MNYTPREQNCQDIFEKTMKSATKSYKPDGAIDSSCL
jgi:hypothetical protein